MFFRSINPSYTADIATATLQSDTMTSRAKNSSAIWEKISSILPKTQCYQHLTPLAVFIPQPVRFSVFKAGFKVYGIRTQETKQTNQSNSPIRKNA